MNSQAIRRRGRPVGNQSRRHRILDAAQSQISKAHSVRLNLRELTREADVTPALLHYYFGDLDGLVTALLMERGEPLLQPLRRELLARPAGATAALRRFLSKWSGLAARHPWLTCCLLRRTGRQIPANALAAALRDAVAQAQHEGSLRSDLPADYIAMALLMLGMLPQFCGTQLGGSLQLGADPGDVGQLTLLNLAMLQRGIATQL
jgi:AcrR family transcriptional regulator